MIPWASNVKHDFCRTHKKSADLTVGAFYIRVRELAVATVDGLTLVLLAAPSCLLDELLSSLCESIAEIATAAEAHLGESFLNVGLNDHGKMGNG